MGIFTNYITEKEKAGGVKPLTQAVEQPAAGTNDGSSGMFKDYLSSKQGANEDASGASAAQPPSDPSLLDQAASTYQEMAPVAGQGAALGYGKQLNAGIQSAAGALDQTVNGQNNFGDQSAPDASLWTRAVDAVSNLGKNYGRAKKGVEDQLAKARTEHPIASALTEIGASIAPSYLTGKGLSSLGMSDVGAQAASIGGAYGYGVSNNEGADRLKDAGKSALTSYGITKGLQLAGVGLSALKNTPVEDFVASEYADYGSPIANIAKATVKETPYGLDFKPKLGDAFSIGQEMKSALTNPNTQAQITQELNHQPEVIQGIIDHTKERLGKLWEPILSQHGESAAMSSDPVLNKAFAIANDITTEGDAAAEPLKKALQQRIMDFSSKLKPADAGITGVQGEVNLKQLTDFQQSLGTAIWRDRAYSKVPAVEGAAKRLWGQIADAASKLDETQGSGGQVKNINNVFKAMYGMEDKMLKGTTVKAMVNPQNVGSENKFAEFVKPFEKLSPNLRAELAPEMHEYLSTDFPRVFAKAKTMVAATGASNNDAISKLFSIAGLRALKPTNLANRAGQIAGIVGDMQLSPSAVNTLGNASAGVQSVLPVIAPSIGGQQSEGK